MNLSGFHYVRKSIDTLQATDTHWKRVDAAIHANRSLAVTGAGGASVSGTVFLDEGLNIVIARVYIAFEVPAVLAYSSYEGHHVSAFLSEATLVLDRPILTSRIVISCSHLSPSQRVGRFSVYS